MANIWAAVRWWDEWQMRILISGSLFIQWFLLLAAPMRKYTVPSLFRRLIWLAYISCDALAIYALATLFNRQAKASSPCYVGYRASSIEVLWAPILLIHLGGREEITAFDIEDNEMWTRQTVTLVSQVTVALYAFYKTWPSSGDNRLLWSAIVLFVIGILSFCEKPWALRRASINRLVAVSSLAAGTRKKPTRWESLFTEVKVEDIYLSLKKKMLLLCRRHTAGANDHSESGAPVLSELDKVQMILSDMSLLAAATDLLNRGQLTSARILERVEAGGEKNMKHWLRWSFGLIYTRANVIFTPAYLAGHVLLVPSLHVAAIVLFATSHKQAYRQFNATDVRMTYVILCLTAVLDVFGLPISWLIYRLLSWLDVPALCATLPGHNLIDGAVLSKKPVWRLLSWLGCCELGFSDRDNHNRRYLRVAGMVLVDLLSSRDDNSLSLVDLDLASYRSPSRDKNWTLRKLDKTIFERAFGKDAKGQMAQSLRGLPFDMSVLRWHIATDLCFRSSPSSLTTGGESETSMYCQCAAAISNYMAHLLYSRPEMLMTGSRKHLFVEAMEKMSPRDDQDGVARFITNATPPPHSPKCSPQDGVGRFIVDDACLLAKELMALPDEATRWEVMYRVWMGMLCYSASMCRGYLHAKSLGEGGEFLSFISLVIALKGGKTLADKLQMPEHGATEEHEIEERRSQRTSGLFGRLPRRVFHRRSRST